MSHKKTAEANIGSHLPAIAAKHGDTPALIFPEKGVYTTWTYEKLNHQSDVFAHALKASGIKPGEKALLMLTSGPQLIATAFALFKMGAIPVCLDPGMGLQRMLACIRHVSPEVFIGIPKAQIMRVLYSKSFKSVKHFFTVSEWFPFAKKLEVLAEKYKDAFPVLPVEPNETAAILFTSGSTGPAKGVVYQHSMFQAQVRDLKKIFNFKPGDIDVPGYPMFALFDAAMGMTAVIPKIDPSKPADCDPVAVVDTLETYKAVMCQGSPTIWRKVGQYCKDEGIKLPELKRLVTFGAPVSVDLIKMWRDIMSEKGDVYTPYGATESLPVAVMTGSEVIRETANLTVEGAGTCVGHIPNTMKVKIIKITDEPIETMTSDIELPKGEIGEIAVYGDVVTQEYYNKPDANKLSKIQEPGGRFWHRMGDVGYIDEKNRLWFCGRKAHRIETEEGTLFPVMAEGMANNHPSVYRTALVGVGPEGKKKPVLVVQPKDGAYPDDEQKEQLLSRQILARYDDHEKFSKIEKVLFKGDFPVDPRHNAKIHREELAVWAEGELQ